eukprot:4518293-Prymnesium_polylepis.1
MSEIGGGSEWMRIWLRMRNGMLGFRFNCCADASVCQFVCMLQEWDLLPTWVKYARDAGVLRQEVSNELFVFGDFNWRPWPLPAMSVVLRSTLRHCNALRHEQAPPALGESPVTNSAVL